MSSVVTVIVTMLLNQQRFFAFPFPADREQAQCVFCESNESS